ncbi:MAG: hypothetical protein U1E05_03450, partial [Patescibacteria group bacterium]|nr:hypothetical protein [Patescibacteria group bacterium]
VLPGVHGAVLPGRCGADRLRTYHLIKLKHLDYRNFIDSGNPLAFALMAKMDYNRKEQVRLKADFLRWICPRWICPRWICPRWIWAYRWTRRGGACWHTS